MNKVERGEAYYLVTGERVKVMNQEDDSEGLVLVILPSKRLRWVDNSTLFKNKKDIPHEKRS